MWRLSERFKDGKGVPIDHKLSAIWLLKAAVCGLAYAQVCLGDLYRYGEDRPQNYRLAIYWYRKAADHGDCMAMDRNALMYGEGMGTRQDDLKAMLWRQISDRLLGRSNNYTQLSRYKPKSIYNDIAERLTPLQLKNIEVLVENWIHKFRQVS